MLRVVVALNGFSLVCGIINQHKISLFLFKNKQLLSAFNVTLRQRTSKMTQGGYQVIIILPIKSKMAAAKKRCFLRFLYFTESSPLSFNVRGLQMTMNLALVLVHISSAHSNLNFAHHFVIYWLLQSGADKNQHQDSYQRETVSDKFVFFFSKLVRQKRQ